MHGADDIDGSAKTCFQWSCNHGMDAGGAIWILQFPVPWTIIQ